MKEKNHEICKIGVDIVIFSIENKKLQVVVHNREKEPFQGLLELPGGLVNKNETSDEALVRKCNVLIGLDKFYFNQFHTFTKIERDPRQRIVSIGYIALVDKNSIKLKDDFTWKEFGLDYDMAFDHNEIIAKAKEFLKDNLSSHLASKMLPKEFPLNKLQDVYEAIEDISYDNRNFRKKILKDESVVETDKIETNVSHRPAKLYKIKN